MGPQCFVQSLYQMRNDIAEDINNAGETASRMKWTDGVVETISEYDN